MNIDSVTSVLVNDSTVIVRGSRWHEEIGRKIPSNTTLELSWEISDGYPSPYLSDYSRQISGGHVASFLDLPSIRKLSSLLKEHSSGDVIFPNGVPSSVWVVANEDHPLTNLPFKVRGWENIKYPRSESNILYDINRSIELATISHAEAVVFQNAPIEILKRLANKESLLPLGVVVYKPGRIETITTDWWFNPNCARKFANAVQIIDPTSRNEFIGGSIKTTFRETNKHEFSHIEWF